MSDERKNFKMPHRTFRVLTLNGVTTVAVNDNCKLLYGKLGYYVRSSRIFLQKCFQSHFLKLFRNAIDYATLTSPASP